MNTLLIVEDDASTRIRLLSIFSRKGFRVRGAKNLHEANMIVFQERPDCILMDLHFPDGHALEDFYMKLLPIQEKNDEIPCPVVILTASNAEEDLRELLASGIYAVHSKYDPIDAVDESIRLEISNSKRSLFQVIEGGGNNKANNLVPFTRDAANQS